MIRPEMKVSNDIHMKRSYRKYKRCIRAKPLGGAMGRGGYKKVEVLVVVPG
jgi:hypothetical protein